MEARATDLWMYTRTQTPSHWMYFPVYTAVDFQPWGEGAADVGCHLSLGVQDHWRLAEADSICVAN